MRKYKWLAVILAMTMLLGMMPAIVAADAHPAIILYAGQDMEVGYVDVSNDADNLYVKYVITEEDWFLTESHVHVGEELEDFPRAGRQLNPVPGLFDYSDPHGWVKEYTYEIPITWTGTVKIAAHAVVQTEDGVIPVSDTITPILSWSRSSEGEEEVVAVTGLGASWDPAVQLLMATPITDPDYVWDGGNDNQYFIGYSDTDEFEWASWAHVSPSGSTDLRLFKAAFNLSPEIAANITQAVLRMPDFAPDAIPINDNIYIFLNEELQFWGGTRVGNLVEFEGLAGVQAIATYLEPGWGGLPHTGWYIPGEFPDLDLATFEEGPNCLAVFAEENHEGGGMSKLELVLSYAYDIPVPGENETAWAATAPGENRFTPQGNWATYFCYDIVEPYAQYVLDITAINNNTGYTHVFTIVYNPNTDEISGSGDSLHAGTQTLSEFDYNLDLDGNLTRVAFRSDYDGTSYYWFPQFTLNNDNSLTFIDGYGTDNVSSATGTWSVSYIF